MLRFTGSSFALALGLLIAVAPNSSAQAVPGLSTAVVVPQSSIERPVDVGVRFHTHTLIESIHAAGQSITITPNVAGPPFAGFAFETPASLACVYRLVPVVPYCNPNIVTTNPSGGSKLIAVVDAYDNPNAMSDLNAFSQQFGLPQVTSSNFQVVYAAGIKPAEDPTGGWEGEVALDIEAIHAMAPGAKIVLVEAASNSGTDLFAAVTTAGNLVAAGGGGEVLMDWGGAEFSNEADSDALFKNFAKVVFISSTGDTPGTSYPSVSPRVVAVGGSTIRRNFLGYGGLIGQSTWQNAGGGPSLYEPRPWYQDGVRTAFEQTVRSFRGTPDIAFDGDPNTGLWIYDSFPMSDSPDGGVNGTNWYVFGGTSLSAAAVTGIINVAGHFDASSALELWRIYSHMGFKSAYHDIIGGTCGPYDLFSSVRGWDYCTGVGVPVGYDGK